MNTHTHPFNGHLSGTTQVSLYQNGKTNLDFNEARDSEWQWHQLGHMRICTSLQTNNHTSTSPLSFLQAGCPSCCPTNSVKALKAHSCWWSRNYIAVRLFCLGLVRRKRMRDDVKWKPKKPQCSSTKRRWHIVYCFVGVFFIYVDLMLPS